MTPHPVDMKGDWSFEAIETVEPVSTPLDFVVESQHRVTATEVTVGRTHGSLGLDTFMARVSGSRALLVGADGVSVEAFLLGPVDE